MGRRTGSRAFKLKVALFVVLLFVFVNLPLLQSLTEAEADQRMGRTGVLVTLAIDAVLLLVVLAIVRPGRTAADPVRRLEALCDVEPVDARDAARPDADWPDADWPDADWEAVRRGGTIVEASGDGVVTILGEVVETTDDEVTVAVGSLRVLVVLDQFVNPVPEGHAARVRGRWL